MEILRITWPTLAAALHLSVAPSLHGIEDVAP